MNKWLVILILVFIGCSERSSSDADYSSKKTFSLKDFEWTVAKVQKKPSIFFQTVSTSLIYSFDNQEYKPNSGLTIVTVHLTAQKAGKINLSAELFIIQEQPFYKTCKGIKVIEPKEDYKNGFTPPRGGGIVSSYNVDVGQNLIIELAFTGDLSEGQSLFVASPMLSIPNFEIN